MEKRCSKCGQVKDVGEFNKRNNTTGVLRSQCKQCHRDYRQANKERAAEYQTGQETPVGAAGQRRRQLVGVLSRATRSAD